MIAREFPQSDGAAGRSLTETVARHRAASALPSLAKESHRQNKEGEICIRKSTIRFGK